MIQPKKIQSISMWRTIACLMVFAVHFGQRLSFPPQLKIITDFGAYGVQLFFIISGFLITKSFYDYGKEHPWKFYAKKAIALLPLYYIVIIYYFVIHTFLFKDVPADPTKFGWFRYVIPINYILPKTGTYFWDNLGITWTIPYFLIAYIFVPLLLRIIKNLKSSIILFFVSLVFAFMSIKGFFYGWCSFLEQFPVFIMGIILYYGIKEEKLNILIFGFTAVAIPFLILGVANKIMYSLLFSVLIIGTKDFSFKSSFMKKVLHITDTYSYTLYLAHGIIFIHILDRFALGRIIEALIAIAGSIILTFLIKKLLESPIEKLLNKLLTKAENKKNTNVALTDACTQSNDKDTTNLE